MRGAERAEGGWAPLSRGGGGKRPGRAGAPPALEEARGAGRVSRQASGTFWDRR